MSVSLDRWIIRGTFITCSPLSIRTGSEEDVGGISAVDWQKRTAEPNTPPVKDKNTIAPVQAIELDDKGDPFIPGTAIKGLLRSVAAQGFPDAAQEEALIALLGDLPRRKSGTEADQSTGGIAIFQNAWLAKSEKKAVPPIRGRTAIHRGTRTARDGFLRHDRAVPAGTAFEVKFILDRTDAEKVALLLALLARIDGKGIYSAVGSGTSQGDGLLEWKPAEDATLRFGQEEMKRWLTSEPLGTSWESLAHSVNLKPTQLGGVDRPPRITFELSLEIDGHFLVSVPAPDKQTGLKKDGDPDRVPFRMRKGENKTALLPGSSLDGALSSQAERIWRTMSNDLTEWSPTGGPECFRLLFGGVAHAGLLDVSMLESAETRKPKQVEFVAIDRFTGGSSDGAKFAVQAFEAPLLNGQIGITLRRDVNRALTGKESVSEPIHLSAAAVGLLALTLKDLAEGDIPLGYGTRKGFGRVAGLRYGTNGWRNLLKDLGTAVSDENGIDGLIGLEPEEAIRAAVKALEAEAAEHRARQLEKSVKEPAQ